MSNARNLANLMGTNTLVPQSKVNLSLGASDLPTGSILQVQSATEDGDFSGSGQNIDIMTLTITPSSTSSKILVMVVHSGARKTTDTQLTFKLYICVVFLPPVSLS